MKKLHTWLLCSALFCAEQGFAQFVNDGVNVFISNNGLLNINDNVVHKAGEIKNNGLLFVTGNWENRSSNEIFDQSSIGKVTFYSTSSEVNGTGTTLFPHLNFKGNGVYKISSRTKVNLTLDIEDAEVQLATNEALELLNVAPESLIRGNGFISSLNSPENTFVRHFKATDSYLFPMGSKNLNLTRFVRITPDDANSNVIGVSFVGHDPNMDGYSRLTKLGNVGEINDDFYHNIKRLGGNSALNARFSSGADEDFNSLLRWVNISGWKEASTVVTRNSSSPTPNDYKFYDYKSAELPLGLTVPISFGQLTNADVLTIYNAFSPDGDGKNDTWEIKNIDDYPDNDLKIFDRSGNLVYQTSGYNSSKYWDGQNLSSATYIYILRVKINGTNKHYRGAVTMVKN
jgi:gliding motility-associated-like protein